MKGCFGFQTDIDDRFFGYMLIKMINNVEKVDDIMHDGLQVGYLRIIRTNLN